MDRRAFCLSLVGVPAAAAMVSAATSSTKGLLWRVAITFTRGNPYQRWTVYTSWWENIPIQVYGKSLLGGAAHGYVDSYLVEMAYGTTLENTLVYTSSHDAAIDFGPNDTLTFQPPTIA